MENYISYLNNLDRTQIKHIFVQYIRNVDISIVTLSFQDKINALVVGGAEYNGISKYRDAINSLFTYKDDFDIVFKIRSTIPYMLHFYNLYHTSPCVNVNYLKNYSNDSEESRKINRDVFAQLFEMIEKSFNDFNYEIFSVTAKFLKDNNL